MSSRTPWYIQLIFWLQKKKYGYVLNSSRIWAKSPRVFLMLSLLYATLERKRSPLSPQLRSLIIVHVSELNACPFCINQNSKTLLERNVPLPKLHALANWRSSDQFTEEEKQILEYAEAVTLSRGPIPDTLRLSMQAHFEEETLVEITALIAFQNLSTKFNNGFNVEPNLP